MKHAYLIIAHNNFEILKKQLQLLDDPRNDIYIHIDAKVKDFDEKPFLELIQHAQVEFLPDRLSITWGGYSQIATELLLLERATQTRHAYYHLLSGVDMPLKTQDEIHAFFDRNPGREYLDFHEEDNRTKRFIERFSLYHVFQESFGRHQGVARLALKVVNKILLYLQKLVGVNRVRKEAVTFYKGANWFNITHELAVYVIGQKDFIQRVFARSNCCDEVFLQTVAMMSPYREKVCNDFQRFIDWERGRPYVFRNEDYELLMGSDKLFARKFDYHTDPKIVDRIYQQVYRAQFGREAEVETGEPLVSIIVPVYNCETYLPRCLDSLLAQTYSNLEIILVDDGAKDSSPSICDDYAAKDSRIKVLHQENGGVSNARNSGLKAMTGEYCAFVDSDDYVSPNMIRRLYHACRKESVEIAVCGHQCVTPDDPVTAEPAETKAKIIDIRKEFRYTHPYAYPAAWATLYSRAVLEGNQFDVDLYVGEDALFVARALHKTDKLAFLREPMYYYVLYPQSANHGQFTQKRATELEAWHRILLLFQDYPLEFRLECQTKVAFACFAGARCMLHEGNESDATPQDYLAKARGLWKTVIRSDESLPHKMGYTFFCALPRLYMFLYGIVRKIR